MLHMRKEGVLDISSTVTRCLIMRAVLANLEVGASRICLYYGEWCGKYPRSKVQQTHPLLVQDQVAVVCTNNN